MIISSQSNSNCLLIFRFQFKTRLAFTLFTPSIFKKAWLNLQFVCLPPYNEYKSTAYILGKDSVAFNSSNKTGSISNRECLCSNNYCY